MFKKQFEKINDFITDMSLVKKFLLAYLFIIAIPTAVLGIYSFRNAKTGTIREAKKNDIYAVQQVKNYINRNMEVCKRAAQQAISNRDFIDFLSIRREYTAEDYILFRSGALYRFESIHNINPDIYSIRFFNDNPHLEEIWPSIYSEDRIRNSPWRQKVMELNGNNYWLLNHTEEIMGTMQNKKPAEVVSLYRDVSYADEGHIAILEVNMEAKFFFGDVYNMDDEWTMLCVLEGNDRLIYNPHSRFSGKWGNLLTQIRQELAKNSGKIDGDFCFELSNNCFMAAYSYIKEIDSRVFKVTSVDGLTKKLDKTRNLILLGIAGGMTILAVVTFLITSVLLKKMKIIIASMRKVQAGNLSVEIPVEGGDEIGELAHHFRKMMEKINELITEVVRKQSAAKDAEIRALQTQINAHFIYNVLEAIKTVAEIDYKYDISDYLTALGRLMRYSMHWSNIYVALKEEISHINNYLALMRLRCENRFEFGINVSDDLLKLEVLKMTIQPIVENAINHGLAPKNWEGRLEISAYRLNRNLCIEVADNGIGMDSKQLQLLDERINADDASGFEPLAGGGIGLKNVNERIKLFYGEGYGIRVDSKESEYTRVLIILPYRKGLWG